MQMKMCLLISFTSICIHSFESFLCFDGNLYKPFIARNHTATQNGKDKMLFSLFFLVHYQFNHCVKNVLIWSFFQSTFSRIRTEYVDFFCKSPPAGIYLIKVSNVNTSARCELCLKLTIKTPERRHWSRSRAFNVKFKYVSHLVIVFLLLNLSMQLLSGPYLVQMQ